MCYFVCIANIFSIPLHNNPYRKIIAIIQEKEITFFDI